ncbi:MAG: trypsin-like peptidase domain-containing protein [Tenericutes bacterium]|jgi:serine protease Do|nr:trypsin-like peptidase domain-containing protein [Mycoplasmatota bacterium]
MKKRRKRFILLLLLIIFTLGLSNCSYFIPVTNSQVSQGTYSGDFYDYDEFSRLPIYISPTYSIDDVDEYNTVLMETKAHIIKANVAITSTITKNISYDTKSGSGFVFMEDDTHYYAITNHHVIDGEGRPTTYEVKTYEDSESQSASVILSSETLDLAVIKFEKNNRTEVEIINITQRLDYRFKSDELVFAIGNPLSLSNTVSFGIYEGITQIENVEFIVIRHSAEIYNGSSGGALVDVDGNLIGVNTWGINDGGTSFAIPNFVVYNFLVSNNIIE